MIYIEVKSGLGSQILERKSFRNLEFFVMVLIFRLHRFFMAEQSGRSEIVKNIGMEHFCAWKAFLCSYNVKRARDGLGAPGRSFES